MCNCNICGASIDLTGIGQTGSTGATGATGANGVAIVFKNSTVLTNTNTSSWTLSHTGTIPQDTLINTGDFVLLDIFARGGDSTLGNTDAIKITFNGIDLVNPDAVYLLVSETYHFPYSVSNTGMQIQAKITRLSATSCSIYLYCRGQGEANRVDMYSASTACNDFDSLSNSLSVSIYNSTANSVKIQDIVCTKYLS